MWQKIRTLICQQANIGRFPNTDNDYREIIYSIEENTENNIPLDINTVKNIFDHWKKGTRDPSNKTKNVISEYLGFARWEDLVENIDETYKFITTSNKPFVLRNSSSFISKYSFPELETLKYGQEIIIRYLPDNEIRLKVLGNDRYRVVSSKNSSLIEDDEISLYLLHTGIEFAAFNVKRRSDILGNYLAARGHLITQIIICLQ